MIGMNLRGVGALVLFFAATFPAFGATPGSAVIEVRGGGEAAIGQRGSEEDCDDAPTCVPLQADTINVFFDSLGDGSYSLMFEVDSPCTAPRTLLVDVFVEGVLRVGTTVTTSDVAPVMITVSDAESFFPDGVVDFELRLTDLESGAMSSCMTTLVGLCFEAPVCIAPSMIEVKPFGDTALLEFEFGPGCAPFPADLEHSLAEVGGAVIFETISFGLTENTTVTSGPFVDLEPGESTFFTLSIQDRDSALTTHCTIEVRACDDPVFCFLGGSEVVGQRSGGPDLWYDVQPGDTLEVIEVCALSACGGPARVQMTSRPPFMEPVGHRKSADGEIACIETKSDDVVESGFAEGTYWAKFHCEDLLTGDVRELKIGYRYTDPGPDDGPAPLCAEDESASPNDTFDSATVINAGACNDDGGAFAMGELDTPVFINGDVDFYRIVGLTPGESYEASLDDGTDATDAPTDTMLGWFAADGVLVVSDDDGGRDVYSRVEFVADDSGAVVLAVAGHGDDDFDGLMSHEMPYEELGHGDYLLSVHALGDAVMPLERQADLNSDGVVDTADLSILIGLFGATN